MIISKLDFYIQVKLSIKSEVGQVNSQKIVLPYIRSQETTGKNTPAK